MAKMSAVLNSQPPSCSPIIWPRFTVSNPGSAKSAQRDSRKGRTSSTTRWWWAQFKFVRILAPSAEIVMFENCFHVTFFFNWDIFCWKCWSFVLTFKICLDFISARGNKVFFLRHLSEVFLKSSSGEFFSLCLEINLLMIVIQMFINKENTIKTCVSELQKSNFDLKEILLLGIS